MMKTAKPQRQPLPFSQQMKTTLATLSMACASFDIWLELASAETRPTNLDAMDEYSEFFRFSEVSHIHIAVLELHTLHDKTPGAISLASLIKGAPLKDVEKASMTKKLLALSPTVEKVKILRDKVLAHRDASFTWKSGWKEANLQRDELHKLLLASVAMFNDLAAVTNEMPFSQNDHVRPDLKRLFRDIDKYRSARFFYTSE
jgi:hypothetical protein